MTRDEFRKATAILFPNVVFNFITAGGFGSYAAFAQGANEGLANLFAKPDSDQLTVLQRGESKAILDIKTVLKEE